MSEKAEPVRSEEADPPEDDMKRRFREALERKNAKAKSGESHADASSKIHGSHGPVGGRRTFRRKSG